MEPHITVSSDIASPVTLSQSRPASPLRPLNFALHGRIQGSMNSHRRKSWMWAEACALLEEAERKHRHFFNLIATASRPVWELSLIHI